MRLLPPSSWFGRALACIAAGLLPACETQAQWSASVTADSDYRFRGVSLSGSRPALRLEANVDAPAGWYAGASVTQARVPGDERYVQWAGYAGYATRIAGDRSVEFGASHWHLAGDSSYDFTEAYAGLLTGRWSLRVNYSPRYFGRPVRTAYLDASGHVPLDDSVRVFGHLGALVPLAPRDGAGYHANQTRTDARVGIGWTLRDVDLRVAWTVVSTGGPFPATYDQRRHAWVFSASCSF